MMAPPVAISIARALTIRESKIKPVTPRLASFKEGWGRRGINIGWIGKNAKLQTTTSMLSSGPNEWMGL
jgi:hypothetical protein